MREIETLESEILGHIREDRLHLNTFMPGNVLEYHASTQTVDVRPALKRTLASPPVTKQRPDLYDVPVIFPRSSGNAIHTPLTAGDSVGIFFCQRSLDDWKDVGDLTKVTDVRLHDLSDAVVIAGLDIEALTIPEPDKMSILVDNGIYIGKPNGASGQAAGLSQTEVFQALSKLCDIVSNLTTTTSCAGGSQTGGSVTTTGTGTIAASVKTQIEKIKAVFDEIGGNSSE